jgi:hypothetical protein
VFSPDHLRHDRQQGDGERNPDDVVERMRPIVLEGGTSEEIVSTFSNAGPKVIIAQI